MNTIALRDTTAGKFRRLLLFPTFVLTSRFGIARKMHRDRTSRAAAALKQRGHDKLIASRDADAIQQDAADLTHLYDTVLAKRPARAIEFGSGQSTVFIAQALHDLGAGHLWSLDADARWLANSEASMPDHLRPFVTFIHSPAVVTEEYGIPAFRYSVVPEGQWDFVLIDGPALTPEVRLSTDLINLPLALGAVGMIDHRWRTATLAKMVAGDRMTLRYIPSLESFSIKAA